MSDIIKQLLLQFFLILLNAFFAATEIALISLNEKKVRALAEDGDKKAKRMLKIIEEPTKFLSTIQIGITLAGFLGSAFAADNFAESLTDALVRSFGVSDAYVNVIDTISVVIITLILSYFTLVLGELVPKRIAMKHKEKLASGVCGIISALTTILKPVIWFLTTSTNLVLRLFGIDPKASEDAVSEEDIVVMLDAGADEGTLDKDDIEYIKNVFKLDSLSAKDVMTQRMKIICVSEDATDDEIVRVISDEGYSRIPIYSGTPDNIVGILYARDYLIGREKFGFKLKDAVKKPLYVPETKHLDALFKEMQRAHSHIAVVIDEYGVTSGIVTMEDILEELVGEIWDEQDEAIELITKNTDDSYTVKTSLPIEEFFEFFDVTSDEDSESSTVNGWVIEKCEDIPKAGYSFEYENLAIRVTRVDNLQTREITVKVIATPDGQ